MAGRRPEQRRSRAAEPASDGGGRRVVVFVAVVVLLVGGLGAYLLVRRHAGEAQAASAAATDARRQRLKVQDVLAVPHLVVRNTESGPSYGKIALIPLSAPTGPRAIVDVSCDRISAVAAGAICLQEVRGLVTTYRAVFLDGRFHRTGTQPLGGVPSRSRMSAEGSYAASTVFVNGHSYADIQFSTETVITDMTTHASLGNLESWKTLQNGAPVTAQDRNFWGVTFVGDGPTFFATLGTGGQRYLVRGDIATRTMTVLGPEGACPSVSPDGATVVAKQADPVSRADHFVVMKVATVATGVPTTLAEGRVVDDQVNWLDDHTVIYGVGRSVTSTTAFDVWQAPVAGGKPTLLVRDAASPSVVRP